MKLSEREKAARRAAFQEMETKEKLDYIFTYYKWLLLLIVIASVIFASSLHRVLTRKEPVLYLAMVNISSGQDLESELQDGFLDAANLNRKRQEVYFYRGLYLSDNADTINHEYAYASRMKVMGAIQTKRLDLALMNQEAYDMISANGYLMDLSKPDGEITPEFLVKISPFLTENEVVIKDNAIEWQLGEAESHERITESICNGLEVTELPLFQKAGFSGEVYLGILANTPRTAEVIQYIDYLLEGA